ncbi:MAG: M48 family metalloprotease [Trueperaceae bacterium]|nr:M48 family metalloprotease [Trueperaceae bacterium]
MMKLNDLFNRPEVEVLGQVLLHSLWQGVGIAVVLAALLWLFRHAKPNPRYWLSLLALFACAALPIQTFVELGRSVKPLQAPSPDIQPRGNSRVRSQLPTLSPMTDSSVEALTSQWTEASPTIVPEKTLRHWKMKIEPLLPWIVLIWSLGVAFLSLRLVLGLRSMRRLRTSFVSCAPKGIHQSLSKLSQLMNLNPVDIRMSRIVDVPLVLGYVKPIILLPGSAIVGLTPHQLEMILAHELSHIKRGDHYVNLLQHIIETLLFFNPAVWWISNQIRQEREYCCDLMAMQFCKSNSRDYAQTLRQLDHLRSYEQFSVAANGGSLLKRIFKLMGKPLMPNPVQGVIGLSLILISIVIASVAMAQTQGGVLKIAFASMQQLDPYKSAAGGEIDAFSQIFDPLIIPDREDYSPTPHLAESWENVDDVTWVFKLRQGVTFQDGNEVFPEGANRELTADDVVYSINRFLEVSTSFTLGEIESVTALDKYTVEIKTAKPDPFLLSDPNRLARVLIVPHEAIEQLGDEGFAQNPIGSGPFELESFIPDQELKLVRNEDYFITPNLDGVEFVFIPDPTVQTIALEAQDIDVVSYLFNIDSVTQLSENPDLTLLPGAGSYRGLGFNVTTSPFDEFEVRDAISKAIDIDAAVNAVVAPYGRRAYGQVPYWFEFKEDPELADLWSYDPEGALEELAEAGFTDSDGDGILDRDGEPLTLTIKTIPGSQVRVLTILVTQLKELGIDANLLQQDVAVWADDLQTGNDTGIFFDYSFASLTGLYSLFYGGNAGKTNTHFYSNPEVDALLDEASATLDFETRNSLWLEAQRKIMADRAGIPLYFENGYAIVNNYVKDFVPGSAGLHLVSLQNNVYLDK